jgi:hypothetical protein
VHHASQARHDQAIDGKQAAQTLLRDGNTHHLYTSSEQTDTDSDIRVLRWDASAADRTYISCNSPTKDTRANRWGDASNDHNNSNKALGHIFQPTRVQVRCWFINWVHCGRTAAWGVLRDSTQRARQQQERAEATATAHSAKALQPPQPPRLHAQQATHAGSEFLGHKSKTHGRGTHIHAVTSLAQASQTTGAVSCLEAATRSTQHHTHVKHSQHRAKDIACGVWTPTQEGDACR